MTVLNRYSNRLVQASVRLGSAILGSASLALGLWAIAHTPGLAIEFSLPGDAAPQSSSGGGSRGDVKFTLPGTAAPKNSSGGGSRGDVEFALPGVPAPRSSSSGGSRTGEDGEGRSVGHRSIATMSVPLTALLPETNLGLTSEARPRLYVYMPPLDTQEAYFSLKDEAGKIHHEETLTVTPGVVIIDLPTAIPELALNQNYQWYFSPIETGREIPPESYEVSGWVKRVTAPDTAAAGRDSLTLAKAYAQAGLWYDTLATLETAQQDQPGNESLRQEWQDLLTQVGLSSVANQAFSQ